MDMKLNKLLHWIYEIADDQVMRDKYADRLLKQYLLLKRIQLGG